jgi:DNA-directed RNA polymerase subunit alpha
MTEHDSAIATQSALELIRPGPWTFAHLYKIRAQVFGDRSEMAELRHEVTESKDTGSLPLAVAAWVIGEYQRAVEMLRPHQQTAGVKALLASSLVGCGRLDDARALVARADNADEAGVLAQVVARQALATGKPSREVDNLLAHPGHLEGTSWLSYLRGVKEELEMSTEQALGHFQAAYEKDPGNIDCAFRYARLLDLHGADDDAAAVYENALRSGPPTVSLLTNLGLLYEDMEEWRRAEICFKALLRLDPTHARIRLYADDVEASKSMHYDEDQERREDKRNAILRTPVTDFELSVRSRNCLAKMGIRTLGDLVRKTEAELLSYKNFGETSLMEIQQILQSKNLRLGMDQDELKASDLGSQAPSGDLTDPLNRPIGELELSVRSRRVVESLKLRTIGDLCAKTEAELMACPNFGQTSLNEVKTKLDELGLGLRS